ncbi:cyanophycin synthetase [Candidatus Kaiserbacteria bacterium]|nr:cyanophycin synthetase [Candidatus Kaiserbacteria bacterium]
MARHTNTIPTRSFVGLLFKKMAREIGAKVLLEPVWKTVGQIKLKDGKKRYFRYSSVDLNTLGASEISRDKDYAAFFMRKMDYPAIQGKSFYSKRWAKVIGSKRDINAAIRYARGRYPLFVKPNDGSQGYGVSLVHNARELRQAFKEIFKSTDVALVQKPVKGRDYRIVVLDGKIISAYERIPLSVVGDGRSTIKQLLAEKQREFVRTGRDTKINLKDPRIKNKLACQGDALTSVPELNRRVYLLDNANLSSGGDAVDVTKTIHPDFKKISINLARDMNLRICGVDIIVSGTITDPPKKYWILETNAAPGLDHYVTTGVAQRKIVEDLYRAVLKAMAK